MPERRRFTSTPQKQSAKVRVAALAERQRGLLTWTQLVALGHGEATISAWSHDGYLHRVLPRVYAVGHHAISEEGTLAAAILYAGPGAMLSHATAAWWWQLLKEPPRTIEVSTCRRCRSLPEVRVHERRAITRAWHRQLPGTPLAQTLLDYAATAPIEHVRRALSEAEYRRLLDLEAIDAVLGRGRPGSMRLRAAIQRHRPELALARSVLEERFLSLCEEEGIQLPEVNVVVAGLMVDFLWREQRVVVEVDGRAAHGTGFQVGRDHERDLILRRAGHAVLRYAWRQISHQPEVVVGDLRAVLAARA